MAITQNHTRMLDGTIGASQLDDTLDLSSKTITLPASAIPSNSVVAFHARYVDSSVGDLSPNNYVIFQSVDANEGTGYSSSTGTFTVPTGEGGTYFFHARLQYDKDKDATPDTNYNRLNFHKNNTLAGGVNLSHYYGRGDYDYNDGTIILTLSEGDTVRVYHDGNATLLAGSYSSFNGFKIG